MAFIYVITNLINHKQYVGETIRDPQIRWLEHQRKSKKVDAPLYRAIRKYKIENFNFEVLEECSDDSRSIREQYWIKYLDTYNQGYNATIGGENGHQIYDYDSIVKKYLELKSISATAKFFNCKRDTVRNILIKEKIYQNDNNHRKQVGMYDLNNNLIKKFNSLAEAKNFLNKKTHSRISEACHGKTKTAYGYIWKFI